MKVSASGCYAWRNRLTKPPCLKRKHLAEKVRNCYFENRRLYGARRIQKALGKTGVKIGRSKVRRLMNEEGLKAIGKGFIKAVAIVHSDRGSQYASNEFRLLLQQNCLRQSMSGKGNCYDNAQAESFFSRFKAEIMEGGVFEDFEQARSEICRVYRRLLQSGEVRFKFGL